MGVTPRKAALLAAPIRRNSSAVTDRVTYRVTHRITQIAKYELSPDHLLLLDYAYGP